jgi:hypothetical protein
MRRHKKTMHPREEEDEEENESEHSNSDIVISDDDESDSNGDTPEERGCEYEVDPWQSIVEKAFDKRQHAYVERVKTLTQPHIDERDTREKTYEDMRDQTPTHRQRALILRLPLTLQSRTCLDAFCDSLRDLLFQLH